MIRKWLNWSRRKFRQIQRGLGKRKGIAAGIAALMLFVVLILVLTRVWLSRKSKGLVGGVDEEVRLPHVFVNRELGKRSAQIEQGIENNEGAQ